MPHCVNIKHPEIKPLSEQFNLSPKATAAVIAVWQEKTGEMDRFPTVEEFSNELQPKLQTQKNTLFQLPSTEGQIASEKTIRDLAARMSDRIGTPVRFESDRSKDYKGKLDGDTAVINLAHATLDTPIHEILGHPIIRTIKNRKHEDGSIQEYNDFMADYWDKHPEKSRKEVEEYVDKNFKPKIKSSQLYQNLLKELEYGKGKEVLDRIKRDYPTKSGTYESFKINDDLYKIEKIDNPDKNSVKSRLNLYYKNNVEISYVEYSKQFTNLTNFSEEQQQEEAIVELLGLMAAEKLDNVKDGKLISSFTY